VKLLRQGDRVNTGFHGNTSILSASSATRNYATGLPAQMTRNDTTLSAHEKESILGSAAGHFKGDIS
jgi:hypothetical protein